MTSTSFGNLPLFIVLSSLPQFLSSYQQSKISIPSRDILNQKILRYEEAVNNRCSVKKVFLEISQNPPENTCEFYEISKKTFFTEHFWATASRYDWARAFCAIT